MTLTIEQRKQPIKQYLGRATNKTTQLNDLLQKRIDFYFKALNSDSTNGLTAQQVRTNAQRYGTNVHQKKPLQSFCQIFLQSFQDLMLRILIVCAILSIVIQGIYSDDKSTFWIEGVTILIAVLVCSLVATTNDYQKQAQFEELNKVEQASNKVEVVRDGQHKSISKEEVVVGDLVVLRSGLEVPVDGLVIRGNSLVLNQSAMTGEGSQMYKNSIEKCSSHGSGNLNSPSPVIISGSSINKGQGYMLTLVTGKDSQQGKINDLIQEDNNQQTPLESKLEDLAQKIGIFGFASGAIMFFILTLWLFVSQIFPKGFDSSKHIGDLLGYVMLAVTIVVVAVPEGLPLAVTLSLAFSVKQMLKEQCLVRRLACCQTMGSAHVICTDKTGTLTQNKMSVTQIWNDTVYGSKNYAVAPYQKLSNGSTFKNLVYTCILYNSNATLSPTLSGTATQIALLNYAKLLNIDDSLTKKHETFFKWPFDSDRKRSTVGVNMNGENYLFLVGGLEIVLSSCNSKFASESNSLSKSSFQNKLKSDIQKFSSKGNRMVALAYKKVSSKFDEQTYKADHFGVRDIEKEGFCMLVVIGIQDLLRPQSRQAVIACKQAGILVIMVTGDNSRTARTIADQVGITQPEDLGDGVCMDGDKFDSIQKGLTPQEFYQKFKNLKVLSRSRPQHKLKLVEGLKKINNVVAVTGDGTNDAPALLRANVGAAMGITGTQVAKNAADIILLDDNFKSIVRSIVWGRNIYDCIKKFLQFQLTVNVVACVLTVISSAVIKQSVLTTVQMLWVNMIMDSLGALALATEPPNAQLMLKRKPVNRSASLITKTMLKHVIGQSLFQMAVLLFLVFQGHRFLPEYPDQFDAIIGSDLSAKYYLGESEGTMASGLNHPFGGLEGYEDSYKKYHVYSRHLTFVFNVFVWMQIFNFFNCRKINDQPNILGGILNNWLFWVIVVLIMALQFLIIFLLNYFFHCYKYHGLTSQQWGLSLLIGFTVMPLSFLLRLLPFWKPDQQSNTAHNLTLQFRDPEQIEEEQQEKSK